MRFADAIDSAVVWAVHGPANVAPIIAVPGIQRHDFFESSVKLFTFAFLTRGLNPVYEVMEILHFLPHSLSLAAAESVPHSAMALSAKV